MHGLPRPTALLLSFVALWLPVCSPEARAQAQPSTGSPVGAFEVFGGYSLLSNSFNGHASGPSHQPLNGWDAAAEIPVTAHWNIKVETAGYYGTSLGSPQHPIFVLGGAAWKHHFGKETGFVEGLAGLGHLNANWWGGEGPGDTNSFATDAGAGLDTPMGSRLAWRIQGDFQYSNFTIPNDQIHDLPNYFGRFTTGIVWRF